MGAAREAADGGHVHEARRARPPIHRKPEAVAALLLELMPRVRGLVRYLVRGDADIEDISQEALLALMHGLHTYRGEGLLRSWADRVVARTTFAWLRRMRDSRGARLNEPMELVSVPSEEAAPDEYLHRQHMVTLLDRISNEQRHSLVLHHVLEMSVPEIAEELGIPLETVRSRLRLGRAALRALADSEEPLALR